MVDTSVDIFSDCDYNCHSTYCYKEDIEKAGRWSAHGKVQSDWQPESWKENTWVQVSAIPPISSVTLGKLWFFLYASIPLLGFVKFNKVITYNDLSSS